MATEKVSLTLDRDVVAEARRAAGPSGLSAFVNEALGWQLQRRRVDSLLADLELENGPVPESLLADALAERARQGRSPAPENKTVDLMAALEQSVAAAKASRKGAPRGRAGKPSTTRKGSRRAG